MTPNPALERTRQGGRGSECRSVRARRSTQALGVTHLNRSIEMPGKYVLVSGVLFGVISVLQALRALYQWPVQVAGFQRASVGFLDCNGSCWQFVRVGISVRTQIEHSHAQPLVVVPQPPSLDRSSADERCYNCLVGCVFAYSEFIKIAEYRISQLLGVGLDNSEIALTLQCNQTATRN